jgi:hypothetical protein
MNRHLAHLVRPSSFGSAKNMAKYWLIDYLRFFIPLKNFSLISCIWRRQHCRWRAAKFIPMLGAQGLWAGRDLYRATPAVTRDLSFSGLIRRTTPFSRLIQSPLTTHEGMWRIYSNPDPQALVSVYKFWHPYTKNNTRYLTRNDPEWYLL